MVVDTDLRAQVASLSKYVQVKEDKERELSTQVLTSREHLEELKKSNTSLQAQNDQLRKQGIHEINRRDQQILELQTDATIGNQHIRDPEQQLSASEAENGNKEQIKGLEKALQAEKDKYSIETNNLKNDVDCAEREAEKEKEERKNDGNLAREREAKAIDLVRRERQLEIDDLKNSQESSAIKKLQERVEFYEMEKTDLKENGKEGWKNLLMRKDKELGEKQAELNHAKGQIKHWYRLYNIFYRKLEGLERNQAYKNGDVDYAEARAGLFMGSESDISIAMEQCVKLNEDLEADVERVEKEVNRLQKYDEKALEEEMNVDGKMEQEG